MEFGLTSAHGSETSHATVTTQQNVPQSVAVVISGLARSTLYHYRLCARDAQQKGGPGCGTDQQLTTQSAGCGETATFSGDVIVIQGDTELRCNTLVVFYEGELSGKGKASPAPSGGREQQIRRMEARGNVVVIQKDQRATGEYGDFDVRIQVTSRDELGELAVAFNSMTQGLRERADMQNDLQIGRQIQAGFLPAAIPQPPGWEIAARFQPAREVAGDFYDAFTLGDGRNKSGLTATS